MECKDKSNPFLHAYHPDHDNLDERFEQQLPAGKEAPAITHSVSVSGSHGIGGQGRHRIEESLDLHEILVRAGRATGTTVEFAQRRGRQIKRSEGFQPLADLTAVAEVPNDYAAVEQSCAFIALDKLDGVSLEIAEVKDGRARLRFPVVNYYIKSSESLTAWKDEAFALTATGDTQGCLRADATGMVDVYGPVA